jgi:hypothetical protein
MERDHAVAVGESAGAFAHGRDDASRLMPEDARCGVRAGAYLLEVGPADAAGVDAEQQFAGCELRYRDGLQAHVVAPTIDGGPHERRDCDAPFYPVDFGGD